tara:strand:+ start:269 stop:484 length:216 start_codon:yes stop_codon:yes gene_type:complete
MTVKFKKDYVTVIENTEVNAELQEQLDRDKVSHDRDVADEQAQKDLKASAKAKLISGEALTEDEADTIVLS